MTCILLSKTTNLSLARLLTSMYQSLFNYVFNMLVLQVSSFETDYVMKGQRQNLDFEGIFVVTYINWFIICSFYPQVMASKVLMDRTNSNIFLKGLEPLINFISRDNNRMTQLQLCLIINSSLFNCNINYR
jgi:hypothetical protein